MFQYFVAFLRVVRPLSKSMASSSCWYVHLPYFEVLTCLLSVLPPCIIFVARWHRCYVMLVVYIAY
jgi:hypothetical protein